MSSEIATAIGSLGTNLASVITVADIFQILGYGIAAGGVFVLAWFGIRKVTDLVMGMLRGGKISM